MDTTSWFSVLKSRTKFGEVIGEKVLCTYSLSEQFSLHLSLSLSLFFHTKDPERMAISPRWSRRPAFSLVKGCCPTKLGCCVKESHWRMIFGFGSWRMALSSSLKSSQIGCRLSIPHLEKEVGCGHKGNDHHLQTQPQVVRGAFFGSPTRAVKPKLLATSGANGPSPR